MTKVNVLNFSLVILTNYICLARIFLGFNVSHVSAKCGKFRATFCVNSTSFMYSVAFFKYRTKENTEHFQMNIGRSLLVNVFCLRRSTVPLSTAA